MRHSIVGQTFDTILAALVAKMAPQHIKTMTNQVLKEALCGVSKAGLFTRPFY